MPYEISITKDNRYPWGMITVFARDPENGGRYYADLREDNEGNPQVIEVRMSHPVDVQKTIVLTVDNTPTDLISQVVEFYHHMEVRK